MQVIITAASYLGLKLYSGHVAPVVDKVALGQAFSE
jgi:hypothetical protein